MSSREPGLCPRRRDRPHRQRRRARDPPLRHAQRLCRPALLRGHRRRRRRLRLAGADDSGITRHDVVAVWSLLDKRQPVFAYLVIVAFVLFHRAMVRLFFAPTYGWHEAHAAPRRSWLARVAGAVVVAVGAYRWLGAEALRDIVPADEATLAKFYEYHSLVHLGALEQIRLGATPYVEAQTQYGLGNQLWRMSSPRRSVSAITASMPASCWSMSSASLPSSSSCSRSWGWAGRWPAWWAGCCGRAPLPSSTSPAGPS